MPFRFPRRSAIIMKISDLRGGMEQKSVIIRDFTVGGIPKKMLFFAVPFMISNAMQVLYALVDMIVVGNVVGSRGLSAVSVASQVFTFMTMLGLGFSTGGQVYISQLVGADKRSELPKTIGTLFAAVLVMGAAMTVLGLIFHVPVLKLMHTPAESYAMAVDYMLVCSSGVIFTYGYNMVSAVLRGMGDSKHPFIFIAIAASINVVLDLLFVAVFGWGVFGAALATIFGQAFSFLCALAFLVKKRGVLGFSCALSGFKPDREVLSKLLDLGVPFALQSAAINVSMMFVNGLVNTMGVAASAVFGVGLKIDDVVNKVTQGILYAVSAMVGQNMAAGNFERVKKIVYTGWAYSFAAYAVFTVVYLTKSVALFSLFSDDPKVIALAPLFVSALVWNFPGMALMRGANGLIQGVGFSRLILLLSLVDGFILRILCSYLLGTVLHMGLYGFFLGYGLAVYGTAIPGAIYFFSGRWKSRRLVIA